MSSNPFDEILQEISSLKKLINTFISGNSKPHESKVDQFKFMPIQEIFERRLMARSTFYKYMKMDKFKLFKFGGCSYVDRIEFENAFHQVKLYTGK